MSFQDFKVIVHKNDRSEAYCGTIVHNVGEAVAISVARGVNAIFAEQRLNYCATVEEES